MMTLHRAALEEFLRTSEGSAPPVFTGRTEILEDIKTAAAHAWMGTAASMHGHAKDTRILQGAPGAGKSALLAELAKQAPPSARVLNLNSADITNPADILIPLARLVNPHAASSFLARYRQVRRVEGRVNVLGTGAGGQIATMQTHSEPQPTLTAFRDWVRGLDPGAGIIGPIIIAIDEAQRFELGMMDPLAKILQGLHDNSTYLPLTLVLAGLSDTADRAAAMGLTRGLTVHTVGALSDDDVWSLMNDFGTHFGLDSSGCGEQLHRLAAPCEGWPRHLHFALQALSHAALIENGILARVDWCRIEEDAAASRTRYYRGQQSPVMRMAVSLVAAVLRDLKSHHNRVDVINSLSHHARDSGSGIEWQLPEGMTPCRFADHLIHQGVLQEMPDGILTSPIPSFRTYLVAAGRLAS